MKIKRQIDEKFAVSREGDIFKVSNDQPIPNDEPLFLLRARDHLAAAALRYYRELSQADGCNDYHFSHLDRDIKAFEDFRVNHPERMKQPGVTRGK